MTANDVVFWVVTGTIAVVLLGLIIFVPDALA